MFLLLRAFNHWDFPKGMVESGEEALAALEQYLDRAVMVGLHQVYVVHGKGTGALRRILTQYLGQHGEVASLRLGNWNEGGAGVTVVKLKH